MTGTFSRASRFLGFLLFACAVTAGAQEYPSRPIHLITPAAPGGTTDLLARLMGQKLTERFGQQVVVENRGSASGAVAVQMVATAPPDGHTLLLIYHQQTINAAADPKLPYHSVDSFTPITQLTSAALLLVVHPSHPAKTLQEFVAWSRTTTEPINFGSAGVGSGGHVAGELYKLLAGVKAEHIPYKGSGPALTDLVAGRYHFAFNAPAASLPHIKAGRLRALAVTSTQRIASMPELPPVAEAVPGFEVVGWYGVVGPARLPAPVVARLYEALHAAITAPDMKDRLAIDGNEAIGSKPDDFRRFLVADVAKWTRVVKESGAKLN